MGRRSKNSNVITCSHAANLEKIRIIVKIIDQLIHDCGRCGVTGYFLLGSSNLVDFPKSTSILSLFAIVPNVFQVEYLSFLISPILKDDGGYC